MVALTLSLFGDREDAEVSPGEAVRKVGEQKREAQKTKKKKKSGDREAWIMRSNSLFFPCRLVLSDITGTDQHIVLVDACLRACICTIMARYLSESSASCDSYHMMPRNLGWRRHEQLNASRHFENPMIMLSLNFMTPNYQYLFNYLGL